MFKEIENAYAQDFRFKSQKVSLQQITISCENNKCLVQISKFDVTVKNDIYYIETT